MKYLKSKSGSLENSILSVWSEAAKKEGNAFGQAVTSAKEKGDKSFVFAGKKYDVEETLKRIKETNKNDKSDDGEGMDAVQPKAVKKKFKDRKDKDIDNDGDVDSSDKYLHKRRKAISKAIKSEDLAKDDEKSVGKVIKGLKKAVKIHQGQVDSLSKDIKDSYEYGTREATANSLNMTPGQSTEDWDKQVGIMQEKNVSMRETIAKMWGVEEGHNPFKKEEVKTSKKEGKTMTGKSETKVTIGMKEK